MNDLNKLIELGRSGKLNFPSSKYPNIVHFAQALHGLLIGGNVDPNPQTRNMFSAIGKPDHLVLILVDGYGMNFVNMLSEKSFIRSNLAFDMLTVFPSTTPTVLTSIATGRWPSEHSILGWHNYLPMMNDVATIIKFEKTSDGSALYDNNILETDAYPIPSLFGKSQTDNHFYLPASICKTPYSRYWSGGIEPECYKDIPQTIKAIQNNIKNSNGPTFNYVYISDVDHVAHQKGTYDPATCKSVEKIDDFMTLLRKTLPKNARLLMTADHGHLDTTPELITYLRGEEELFSLTERKPSGDARIMYTEVSKENQQHFFAIAKEQLGPDFITLTTSQAEQLELFGENSLSTEASKRLGNIMILSTGRAILEYRSVLGVSGKEVSISHHSGLTNEEMRIPLVIG